MKASYDKNDINTCNMENICKQTCICSPGRATHASSKKAAYCGARFHATDKTKLQLHYVSGQSYTKYYEPL